MKKTSAGTVAIGALLTLLSLPAPALAIPVTRFFEFSADTGPLAPFTDTGSFTYDDSIAPIGGGYVSAVGLFTDLSLSVGGTAFDETTANSGWIQFDASGGLLEAHFGSNCHAGSCVIVSGTDAWWIRVGEPGFSINDFAYSRVGVNNFFQTNRNRLIDEQVPEPATLTLLGAGLAGFVASRRRKSSA